MASLETGRVCMKVVGRESGGYCVVLKNVNKSFALVTGPKIMTGVKRRNANVLHIQPTEYKVEISEDANDEQVIAALEKAGLVTKFGLKRPSAAQMKAREKKDTEKAARKAEEKTDEKSKKKESKAKEKK